MSKDFAQFGFLRRTKREISALNQRGAVLILATIGMGVLLAMGGLAVDAGRLFVTKTELQSAMDACALAASAKLQYGNPSSYFLQAAEAHGRAMSDPSLSSATGGSRPLTSVNRALFQGQTVLPGSISVEFSQNLNGPFATIGGGAVPATSRFVRCNYNMTGIPLTLIRALTTAPVAAGGTPSSIGSVSSVSASAVASRTPGVAGNPTSSTTCGVFPISACLKPSGVAPGKPWGYAVGDRIAAPCSGGGAGCTPTGPGTFGWLDFTPPSGGAPEVAGLASGAGQCGSVPLGLPVVQTGVATSIEKSWNSRFGIYGPGGTLNQTNATPDYTGFAYNPALAAPVGSTTYATDYTSKVQTNAVFNAAAAGFGGGAFGGGFTMLTQSQYAAYGRSRRLVTAPVVDCSEFAGGTSSPAHVLGFACLFLLAPYPGGGGGSFTQRVEYLGSSGDANSPCILSGSPGGGGGGGGGATASVPYLVR